MQIIQIFILHVFRKIPQVVKYFVESRLLNIFVLIISLGIHAFLAGLSLKSLDLNNKYMYIKNIKVKMNTYREIKMNEK